MSDIIVLFKKPFAEAKGFFLTLIRLISQNDEQRILKIYLDTGPAFEEQKRRLCDNWKYQKSR
jgi:hypothetical protein